MKRVVVVSGASSGIGEAICAKLLHLGYSVIGISRNIKDDAFRDQDFTPLRADLSDETSTLKLCQELKNRDIYMLINCAGFARFAPHEELSSKNITQMVFLNLTSAMLLTNAMLRSLKKNGGYLINISSIEALRASKFAAVYGATKSGMKAFGDVLFEETRKSMLSVVNINPDMTQSPFYDDLRFTPTQNELERLLPSDIADAIEHILSMPKRCVVSEYTLRSLNFGIAKK